MGRHRVEFCLLRKLQCLLGNAFSVLIKTENEGPANSDPVIVKVADAIIILRDLVKALIN